MHKRILVPILIATALLGAEIKQPTDTQSSWGLSGQSETVGIYRDTSGQGATGNNDGYTYRQELGLKSRGALGSAKAGVEVRGRATNDKRVSQQDIELLSFRSYYRDNSFEIELGDVAKMYNPLIFSGALKGSKVGVKQHVGEDGSLEYSMIGGIQSSSWKDIFEQEQDQRDAIAGEIKYKHATAQFVALSTSYAKDRFNDTNTSTLVDRNASEALSVGLQWDWRFSRYLRFKGDSAYTNTQNHYTGGQKENKYGIRMTLYTKPIRAVSSNFKYERYDGGFVTLTGSAAQNRERLENTTTWSISRQVRSRLTLKGSRDNLDGTLGETQNILDGLISLNYRPDFMKRGDFALRVQYTSKNGRGSDTDQLNAGVDFSDRLKNGWRYGLGYEYTNYKVNDEANATNYDNQLHTFRGQLAYKYNITKTNRLRASLKFDISLFEHEDVTQQQTRYGGTFDAGYDYDRMFGVDGLFTSKNTDRDLSVNTSYELYQLIGQYKPFNDNSHVLKLRAQKRDYHGGTAAQSYVEDEVRLSYAFAF